MDLVCEYFKYLILQQAYLSKLNNSNSRNTAVHPYLLAFDNHIEMGTI